MRTLLVSGNGRWAPLDEGARQSGALVSVRGAPFADEAGKQIRKNAALMTANEWTRFCKPVPKKNKRAFLDGD